MLLYSATHEECTRIRRAPRSVSSAAYKGFDSRSKSETSGDVPTRARLVPTSFPYAPVVSLSFPYAPASCLRRVLVGPIRTRLVSASYPPGARVGPTRARICYLACNGQQSAAITSNSWR